MSHDPTSEHAPLLAKSSSSSRHDAGNAVLGAQGLFGLRPAEEWWRNHSETLEAHGYRLRPRFRPGWTPSWLGTQKFPLACEDAYPHHSLKVIDATRLSDGLTVAIKQVKAGSEEISINKLLSTEERLKDPQNHAVPLLDSFTDDKDSNVAFLVMPLLRNFDDPPFSAVQEVIDFVRQTLQGLVYIHRQGVAHRDCSDRNIMMDGRPLFPGGFHPSWKDFSPKLDGRARALKRRDVDDVKYFFIDFGISSFFDDPSAPRLVKGLDGLDKTPRELYGAGPYDPFLLDVYILGNVYRKAFINRYYNMQFLAPLVEWMTQDNPADRPSASEALEQFELVVRQLKGVSIRWRLQDREEGLISHVFWDLWEAVRELAWTLKWIYRYLTRRVA